MQNRPIIIEEKLIIEGEAQIWTLACCHCSCDVLGYLPHDSARLIHKLREILHSQSQHGPW